MPETVLLNTPETETEEPGTMGFLDHLDELRKRIFNVAIFVFVTFIVCWGFSKPLYNFLSKPVSEALQITRLKEIGKNAKLLDPGSIPEGTSVTYIFDTAVTINKTVIPAGTAVNTKITKDEQGQRVLSTTQTIITGGRVIPEGFIIPSSNVMVAQRDPNSLLVVHTVQGAFNLYVKVAFYGAIFFSIPYILFQIYAFVAPGLYAHERSYVWPVLIMATVFFLLGAAFGYYIAFPRACQFLIGEAENFQPYIEVNEYFDLIITIVLGLGLVFEIPTLVLLLARIGLVTAGFLLKAWRVAILVIFVLAAVLSPTSDIPNMMVFAIPMILLYYFSVGLAYFFGRDRQTDAEAEA
ncbi:MAG: twin-arginine translocase subunit TatC [Blastocatellia bacterium]|nr:twin-arginine translocase subunit TatC [Blastocatellia bacterium]